MIRKVIFLLQLIVLIAVAENAAEAEAPKKEAEVTDTKPNTEAGEQKSPPPEEEKKAEAPKKKEPQIEFSNPHQAAPPYVPTELTPEEREKFKIAPDGVPYRFPEIWALSARDPEDPIGEAMLKEMHNMIQDWPDGTTYDHVPDIPDTHQPIELTTEKFKEIFYNNGVQETVWVVVFLKTKRSQPQFYHSDYTMNSLKVLSDYYRGKIRFGYVNTVKNECLKEAFGLKTVPNNFLIKDGMVFEMGALQIQFKNIKDFIEGDYLEGNKVYQRFKLPWIFPEWFLPVKYAEDWLVKFYLNKCRFNIARWFRIHNWIDGETPLYEMSPYID